MTEITADSNLDPTRLPLGVGRAEDGSATSEVVSLPLAMLNRHGLIAGATGTGKTRTLQLIAEGLAEKGVPVLLTDVKGDLSGVVTAGTPSEKLLSRTAANHQAWSPAAFSTEFLTVGDATDDAPGVSVRARVSDLGPLLLARALDLNVTQTQALQLIFSWADQNGLMLDDLKDLRAVINFLTSDLGKPELAQIGGVSAATAGVILRAVAVLESQNGEQFFGEPAFDTMDLFRTDANGNGILNVLRLREIDTRPTLVSTFLMWMLADIFGQLPEVGDLDKPKLVFFFDEAHLLFNGASAEFLRQVVQTVRLIRSKGVGIFFITQSPSDIPEEVLAQLGCRVQHALRAFTPKDARALKEAAETFPITDYDLPALLTSLGVGEAVVTYLNEKGSPSPVIPTRLWAPRSVMGPAEPQNLSAALAASALFAKYGQRIDDESAFETLEKQSAELTQAAQEQAAAEQSVADQEAERKARELRERTRARTLGTGAARTGTARSNSSRSSTSRAQSPISRALGSLASSLGRQLGNEISRTIFGSRRR